MSLLSVSSLIKYLFFSELRILGCTCFVQDIRLHIKKLDAKSLKWVFLNYSRVQKRYRCYCSSLNKYVASTDVVFLEDTLLPHSNLVVREDSDGNFLINIAPPCVILQKPPIFHTYSRRSLPNLVLMHVPMCQYFRPQIFLQMKVFPLLFMKVNVLASFVLLILFHIIHCLLPLMLYLLH